MRFEWDDDKDQINRAKHGVGFRTARFVFDDPFLVSSIDDTSEREERWLTIGTASGRVLFVVHMHEELDGEILVRLISARKATSHERLRYERGR